MRTHGCRRASLRLLFLRKTARATFICARTLRSVNIPLTWHVRTVRGLPSPYCGSFVVCRFHWDLTPLPGRAGSPFVPHAGGTGTRYTARLPFARSYGCRTWFTAALAHRQRCGFTVYARFMDYATQHVTRLVTGLVMPVHGYRFVHRAVCRWIAACCATIYSLITVAATACIYTVADLLFRCYLIHRLLHTFLTDYADLQHLAVRFIRRFTAAGSRGLPSMYLRSTVTPFPSLLRYLQLVLTLPRLRFSHAPFTFV